MNWIRAVHTCLRKVKPWSQDPGMPPDPPRDINGDCTTSNDGNETVDPSPEASSSLASPEKPSSFHVFTERSSSANEEDASTRTDDGSTAAVLAHATDHRESRLIGGEAEASASCRQNYLVMGRLFKLHPNFDSAIEGILAGDASGCVILIHETRDEEWTRDVWKRLRKVLVPRGDIFLSET